MFAKQPNNLIGIDVAAFDNSCLQLLDAQLHAGDLLDQRLFWLSERAAEFTTVGVQEGSISHGADGPLINPRQRNAGGRESGAAFGSGGMQHSFPTRRERVKLVSWVLKSAQNHWAAGALFCSVGLRAPWSACFGISRLVAAAGPVRRPTHT